MIYYSSNGDILDTDKYRYLNSGARAKVYHDNDCAFKVYRYDTKYRLYLSRKEFKYLKSCDIPHVVKLRDYYHQYNKLIDRLLPMDGYTMDRIPTDETILSFADSEYLSLVINQLEEILKELLKYKLCISDSHKDNIIFNKDGVFLIDIDEYWRSRFGSEEFINSNNKGHVIYALNSVIEADFKRIGFKDRIKRISTSKKGTLTDDFYSFCTEDNIEKTIKKYVLKN